MTNRSRYARQEPAVHADSRASVSITAVPFPLGRWLVGLVSAVALALPAAAESHVAGCHSRKCDRRIHAKRAAHWCRTHAICLWRHRWEAQSPGWRSWAYATEGCESGHNPRAIGGGGTYRGALQFDFRTWGEAGGYGDPVNATIYEQRVRAITLARRVGTGRWPVCGR